MKAAQQPDGTQWISVKERLPEPGQLVLCYIDGMLNKYAAVRGENDRVFGSGLSMRHVVRELVTDNGHRWGDEGVTHWTPIPKPPEQ